LDTKTNSAGCRVKIPLLPLFLCVSHKIGVRGESGIHLNLPPCPVALQGIHPLLTRGAKQNIGGEEVRRSIMEIEAGLPKVLYVVIDNNLIVKIQVSPLIFY
jgi:hypothetical protein